MGVKVTFVRNEINIEKSDAELLLLLFQQPCDSSHSAATSSDLLPSQIL